MEFSDMLICSLSNLINQPATSPSLIQPAHQFILYGRRDWRDAKDRAAGQAKIICFKKPQE
jgi:hypothetical protein